MSLPISNATVVRNGIPFLGHNATTALSLTLTPDQVEAMCARLMPIKKLVSQSSTTTQFPSEIDFEDGKMYIGKTTFTSFNSGEETGVCEMSSRTSSAAAKSPALSAPIVGNLTVRRGLDAAASGSGKATEAEKTKKTPIATEPNGKKSRAPGVASLTKQAITNRVVPSQINPPTPCPRPAISSVSNNPSKPSESSSSPSSSTTLPTTSNSKSTTNGPNFTSLRSRMLHFIATVARPKEVAISDFMNTSRIADDEVDVREIFDEVAQEIPGPKKSDPAYWKWDLKSDSWLEIRPFGFPGYTADERTQASRRARIYSRISPQNPVWEHFSMRVDSSALATAKAITDVGVGGGSNVKSKKAAAKSIMPKRKSASKPRREDKESVPKPANGSTRKRKLADLELEPASDMEEGELPPKEAKRRRIIGLPKVSKRDTVEKITKKAPATEKNIVGLSTSKHNQESHGTKASGSSHRTNSKVRERDDEKKRDNRDREKGKERVTDKESNREREKREMEKGGSEYEEERPPFNHLRTKIDGTKESVDQIKTDKGRARVKRKRRTTPSFSSDDERDDDETQPLKRATIPTSQPTFTNTTTPKPNATKEHKSMSALPNDKEGLERRYGWYYAKYLHIMSMFYTDKAKVEATFALDNDGNTAEGDSDLMDIKQLTGLCEELHQTKQELERIRKAHADLDDNAL